MNFGFQELLIILLIVVVLFGARKLPELGKGLGEAIRGFKAGLKDEPTNKGDDHDGGPAGPTAR